MSAVIDPSVAKHGRILRLVLTLLTASVSVAGAIWLEDLSHQVASLRSVRRHLLETGFVMFTLFAIAVPVGTTLHAITARDRGRRPSRAWGNAAIVLAYGAAMAVLAWLVTPSISATLSGGRGGGSAGAYAAWLVFVLIPFAAMACAGGLYTPDEVSAGPLEAHASAPRQEQRKPAPLLSRALVITAIAGWALGAIPFVLLVIGRLVR